MNTALILRYLCIILAFVPAIVLHEVGHAFAAYKLGDPTAKNAGRLTLNPIAHVDPFGTVLLPLMLMLANAPVFGYAKPVPYNPRYFEDKRKGDLILGLSGPAMNLIMALIGAGLAWAFYGMAVEGIVRGSFFYYFYLVFLPYFTLINLYLMFFNLLPIPPLDGSSIFAFLLPEKYLGSYYRIEQYAMPVLMVVLILVPMILPFNPIAIYMDFFAGNVANFIYPFAIS